jgi:hypothetical protein
MSRTSFAAKSRVVASVALVAVSCAKQEAQRSQPPPGYYPPSYGAPQPGYGPAPYPQQPYPQQTYPQQPQGTAPPPPTAAPTAPQPPPPASLPVPPVGSFDASGSITATFMRQEPPAVLAELIGGLANDARARVQGVPVKVIEDPKEVNAFAGCTDTGSPFVAVTSPLLLIMARTSEVRAFDETWGTTKYNDLTNGIANEVKARKNVVGPAPGFLPLPQVLDPRKLARQKQLFDEQLAFVLGHELAHHHRGHTGCANGQASNMITPRDIGRLLSNAVPVFNQPNEIEADVQGTFNLLDTGARRQGGTWTEEGAVMTLDFFSRLQSLGVETVVLGFLMTHPAPQFRLPIVNTSAQQWRSNGGRAPAFPFQLPL